METRESGVKHGRYMRDLLARAVRYLWQGNSHISHVPTAVLQYVHLIQVVLVGQQKPFLKLLQVLYL